jgi:excisionase family DNA binding protein
VSNHNEVCSPIALTAHQVSELLQIPVWTVYEMAKDGRLPGIKIGRHVRFSRQRIEALFGEVN